ncbi:MAG: glycoside hydrolase [Actinomycetota bacterium]|nr:glycoside hydrolase [Actinomycetota bacterium]
MTRTPRCAVSAVLIAMALLSASTASANVALTQVSSDPFINSTSAHRTQVEPDTFAVGSTVVAAFQSGRFFDGGSSDIGWATSLDDGATWTNGFLPRITKFRKSGPYDRVSDPSVAYDAAHGIWLISSLAMLESPSLHGAAIVVSRSRDGGLTWGAPVTVATGVDTDKNWTTCDSNTTSPFYGNCYTEWDDHGAGNVIEMNTSTDGGRTWGPSTTTADNARGLGGQPLVRPDGTVVVPIDNVNETAVLAFGSTDGGTTWSSTVTVASISSHAVAGGLRSGPLVSAEIDAAGKVYVAWHDCRFESGCPANDIVMSTSNNGTSWSAVKRIPISNTSGVVDRFLPGLAVDRSSSGAGAHLGLTYYYYPSAQCTTATCQLQVGYVSSIDGGRHWSRPTRLAGPMSLSWLASTSQGWMVGDYISTSFSSAGAHPVFAVANAPAGSVLDEAMYSPATGLAAASGTAGGAPAVASGDEQPVAGFASDHAAGPALTRR